MEAGVQHREALRHPALAGGGVDVGQGVRVRVVEQGVAGLLQELGQDLRLLDRAGADEDRLVALMRPVDLLDDAVVIPGGYFAFVPGGRIMCLPPLPASGPGNPISMT